MSVELASFDIKKAKAEIKLLVDKYEREKASGRLESYSEEQTKNDFILRLFKALGWDVYNEHSNTLTAEEKASKGHVDYAFRISDIPKFFVEAKSFKAGVDREEYALQAINYSYHKSTTWAILTNFEKVRVFNADWKGKDALQTQFFSLDCKNFLSDFDQLLLLSRDSMLQDLLDKQAEKWGKKVKKSPIDKQLLSDFNEFREILTKSILRKNESLNLTSDELDESVQHIIDRLIFIKTVEDREIEPRRLLTLAREDNRGNLWKKLSQLYRDFDEMYDSNLFAPHDCEKLVINDETLETVIKRLHETDDHLIQYNFANIDADVLGNVYEQYLGHILKKTKKSAILQNGSSKRKEEAIYYTPTYVVGYIIKNTVGVLADDKNQNYKRIKIIDPSCGSGSFLIKALDYLISLDANIDRIQEMKTELYGKGIATERFYYLKNNIFGVDLDPKAVEIAQLNLMLRSTERKERLPQLQCNIRLGNSLITKSQFSDRNIDWREKFPQVFRSGRFDVVVGNPPYFNIKTLHDERYKEGLQAEFPEIFTGQNDILYFFFGLSKKILREGGYLGFIVSRYFIESNYAEKLREFLTENMELMQIIDFGSKVRIFKDASINTCIIILRNVVNRKKDNIIKIVKVKNWTKSNLELLEFIRNNISNSIKTPEIEIHQKRQADLSITGWMLSDEEVVSIIDKLSYNSVPLGLQDDGKGACKILKSLESGLDQTKIGDSEFQVFCVTKETIEKKGLEKEILKPLIRNGMIRRYQINYNDEYLILTLDNTKIEKYPNIEKHLSEFETQLKERYDYKKGNFPFWRLSNLRNIDQLLSKEDKLFVSFIAPENRFVFIKSDSFICKTDVYVLILNDRRFNLRYIQGILNSKLMNYWIKHNTKAVDGSARTSSGEKKSRHYYTKESITNIPIKTSPPEMQEKLVELVIEIETQYNLLKSFAGKDNVAKKQIEEKINFLDRQIDSLVCQIYDITEEMILE